MKPLAILLIPAIPVFIYVRWGSVGALLFLAAIALIDWNKVQSPADVDSEQNANSKP